MQSKITPLFIFSLPRSGSTLLQRIIGASDKVSTHSESWLLLPHLAANTNSEFYTEYGHKLYRKAFNDLINVFPGGKENYIKFTEEYYLNLYSNLSDENAVYYLDKTPRYHLICEEIIEMFPNAKFIFLWRNPSSVISSILNTWFNGEWKMLPFEIDLFKGLNNLITTFNKVKNNSNVYSIRYEDLISNDTRELELEKLGYFLNIGDISFKNLKQLNGSLGDKPVGEKERNSRRKDVINSRFRKKYVSKVINSISSKEWEYIGYNKNQLIKELSENRFRSIISISDLKYVIKHMIRRRLIPESKKMLY